MLNHVIGATELNPNSTGCRREHLYDAHAFRDKFVCPGMVLWCGLASLRVLFAN
jgi:hypothetical protein